MKLPRLSAVHFDDDEQLLSVVVVVAPGMLDRIRALLPDTPPIDVVRGTAAQHGRQIWIELSDPQITGLIRAAETVTATDPRYVPGLWDLWDCLVRVQRAVAGENGR